MVIASSLDDRVFRAVRAAAMAIIGHPIGIRDEDRMPVYIGMPVHPPRGAEAIVAMKWRYTVNPGNRVTVTSASFTYVKLNNVAAPANEPANAIAVWLEYIFHSGRDTVIGNVVVAGTVAGRQTIVRYESSILEWIAERLREAGFEVVTQ